MKYLYYQNIPLLKIETTTLKYVSDGLYPSIMVEKPGCHVRVLNYYSETKQHKESVLTQSKELKKAATEEVNYLLLINPWIHICSVRPPYANFLSAKNLPWWFLPYILAYK